MKFINEYKFEWKEFHEGPLFIMEKAFEELQLKNCWVLKRAIEYTLALGNILNAGSDKG